MTTRDEMFEQAHKLKGATPEVEATFPDKVEIEDLIVKPGEPFPVVMPVRNGSGWNHMQVKEATFSLSMIVPKGEYANVKPMLSVTFEGQIDFDKGWATVEEQLRKEVVKLQASIAEQATHTPNITFTAPTAQVYTHQAIPSDVEMCAIHNKPLENKISKKTGKPYTGHMLSPGKMCFGS